MSFGRSRSYAWTRPPECESKSARMGRTIHGTPATCIGRIWMASERVAKWRPTAFTSFGGRGEWRGGVQTRAFVTRIRGDPPSPLSQSAASLHPLHAARQGCCGRWWCRCFFPSESTPPHPPPPPHPRFDRVPAYHPPPPSTTPRSTLVHHAPTDTVRNGPLRVHVGPASGNQVLLELCPHYFSGEKERRRQR